MANPESSPDIPSTPAAGELKRGAQFDALDLLRSGAKSQAADAGSPGCTWGKDDFIYQRDNHSVGQQTGRIIAIAGTDVSLAPQEKLDELRRASIAEDERFRAQLRGGPEPTKTAQSITDNGKFDAGISNAWTRIPFEMEVDHSIGGIPQIAQTDRTTVQYRDDGTVQQLVDGARNRRIFFDEKTNSYKVDQVESNNHMSNGSYVSDFGFHVATRPIDFQGVNQEDGSYRVGEFENKSDGSRTPKVTDYFPDGSTAAWPAGELWPKRMSEVGYEHKGNKLLAYNRVNGQPVLGVEFDEHGGVKQALDYRTGDRVVGNGDGTGTFTGRYGESRAVRDLRLKFEETTSEGRTVSGYNLSFHKEDFNGKYSTSIDVWTPLTMRHNALHDCRIG